MSLPLSTIEGFVLSRVDGHACVDDIAMMTSVQADKVLVILERLADLGAVTLPWKEVERAKQKAACSEPDPAPPPSRLDLFDYPDPQPRFDAGELDGPADIDRKTKRRILNAYHLLSTRTFYELLGVEDDAPKADIRAAYFELSKVFHPDAFFGKDLGSFRSRLEAVFQRLTEAYEVLGRKKRRTEYDAYLTSIGRPPKKRSLPPDGPESGSPSTRPSHRPTARPAPPSGPPVEVRPRASVEARKAAMAARLRQRMDSLAPGRPAAPSATSRSPTIPPQSPTGVSAPASESGRPGDGTSAVRALREALSRSTKATYSRLDKVFGAALAAEQAGDLAMAVDALCTVLEHNPRHQDALVAQARVQAALEKAQAASYLLQARYEQKRAQWTAAAVSWFKVAERLPRDASAHRSAALAALHCGKDLPRARKCAEQAVQIQSDSVPNLTTLARVLLASGLKLNARRELEKAVKLNPHDELANNLLREAT